ncbi:MAG: hypothetical protein WAM42_17510 [Candidatus Nitrosopolaris sp.]
MHHIAVLNCIQFGSGAAKHSILKGVLNPISIAGRLDKRLVEVEYKGRYY